MSRVTVTRRIDALRCSRESFANLCQEILKQSNSEGETVYLGLTLPKSQTLRGSFTSSEVSTLPEIDRAKRVYLATELTDASIRITLSVSESGGGDYLEVDADSAKAAESVADVIVKELRQRRPWFWPFKTLSVLLLTAVFGIAGAIVFWMADWPGWLTVVYILIFVPAVFISNFTRRLQIGERSPSKFRSGITAAAKWTGLILLGAVLSKVIDSVWDHMW